MPQYDYLCNKGHETEVGQRIVEDALTVCPRKGCRSKAKRLICKTNFQLKGNGWFANGYSGSSNVAPTTKADKEKAKAARVASKKSTKTKK
jgi:putative FmdB family regulatory protein